MKTTAIIDSAETIHDARQDPPRIVEAVAYLNQCRRANKRLAIVTGEQAEDLATVVDRFVAALPPSVAVARTPAPTDSRQTFLESLLVQFGFDPFEASVDDLQRLLVVMLRQGSSEPGTNILIIEEPQSFGPHVLETMRELLLTAADMHGGPLFVLIGHNDLNRVLDSSGMAGIASLTRSRFCLDREASRSLPGEPPPSPADSPSALVVMSEGQAARRVALDRDRMLIGRSEHNDLCLPGRYVSRQHALLLRSVEGDWLIDLKSTNGTIVNSRLISRCRLADGDIIDFGDFRVRYENALAGMPGSETGLSENQFIETVIMRSLKALHEPQSPAGGQQRRYRVSEA